MAQEMGKISSKFQNWNSTLGNLIGDGDDGVTLEVYAHNPLSLGNKCWDEVARST